MNSDYKIKRNGPRDLTLELPNKIKLDIVTRLDMADGCCQGATITIAGAEASVVWAGLGKTLIRLIPPNPF